MPGRRIEVQVQTSTAAGSPTETQATSPASAPRRSLRTDEFLLALIAGFGLSLGCALALTQANAGALTNLVLPPLLGLLVGATLYSLLRKRAREGEAQQTPSNRQVRAQSRRVRAKCRSLQREARRAGGVFGDLQWQARELAGQAAKLADLIIALRRAAQDVRTGLGDNPLVPPGVSASATDEVLRRELDAAKATQDHLGALIAENSRHQQVCLTQLERIEDLVDVARLEASSPVEPTSVSGADEYNIVEEVEMELQAAREALDRVQQLEA